MKIKETKKRILKALESNQIDIKEALEICEEYGWEVSTGKWHLESPETDDKVNFETDEELIEYAKLLKEERQ